VIRGKILLYPLLSGYQVQRENRPKFFAVIVVEVVWDEGEHFGTVRKKLDKFSTFGDLGAGSITRERPQERTVRAIEP
jgi:hypothetical protein